MSARIARVDTLGIRITQVLYDWLLDRYGVLVGTFRAGAVSASFFVLFIDKYLGAGEPHARLLVLGLWAAIFIPLIAIFLVRPHLERENGLQDARRFVTLNGGALLHQEREALQQRVFILVLVALVHFVLNRPDVFDIVSTAFLVLWLWSRAVMVRDRDESRLTQYSARLACGEELGLRTDATRGVARVRSLARASAEALLIAGGGFLAESVVRAFPTKPTGSALARRSYWPSSGSSRGGIGSLNSRRMALAMRSRLTAYSATHAPAPAAVTM